VATRKRWSELSERTRKAIMIAAGVEGALKVAALIDLARRPATQVRGPKPVWAAAIVLVNSGGALPIGYFRCGRRKPGRQPQPTSG
jgi:hypothetical protein